MSAAVPTGCMSWCGTEEPAIQIELTFTSAGEVWPGFGDLTTVQAWRTPLALGAEGPDAQTVLRAAMVSPVRPHAEAGSGGVSWTVHLGRTQPT